jgi:NTE family protein
MEDRMEARMTGNPVVVKHQAVEEFRRKMRAQVVLVLQGGGALGAYQVGVYQALHEAGVEPDWIIGTSIGAINAGLIAGNEPRERLTRLIQFWKRMERRHPWTDWPAWTGLPNQLSYWATIAGGIPGFFVPHLPAFCGAQIRLGADRAGFYSTAPLRETLQGLIDFQRLNQDGPRLTVGAANVRTSMMRYFDSRDMPIGVEHIMASGALPPAFPAVHIEGEHYWDGGILSNTPTEVIFDDNPRRSSLIFAVHLWNPTGPTPTNIWEVLNRHKDVQYSSRIATHIGRLQQAHRLRHVINQLTHYISDDLRTSNTVQELASYGCQTQMHVVRLMAPRLDTESHTKDIDFSPSGIRLRQETGYTAAMQALAQAPWLSDVDPLEGVVLHEPSSALAQAAE